jgi:hypothetical protein
LCGFSHDTAARGNPPDSYAPFVLTSIKNSEGEVKKAERLAPALTEGRPFESLRRGIDIPATAVVAENVPSARFSSRLNTVMTAAWSRSWRRELFRQPSRS